MEWSQFLADWHPRLVPFPIVLLLLALVMDAAGVIFRSQRAHWAGKWFMVVGTAFLLLAFICGICAEIWAGRSGVPHDEIQWHELIATVAAWGFILLTAWRLFLRESRRWPVVVYAVCGFALYSFVALAGHRGGELVQQYGAAVQGARADTVLSMHDLNTLAERQTDKNLQYSDLMHHCAGIMVLALAVALFLRELRPQVTPKLWWINPALLIAGGGLLFFFADLDLYAPTDLRQFYDREVQMHKFLAITMTVVGLMALRRKFKVVEFTAAQYQNRLIAVFALLGGGALFTHVHSVAPYANVAAGVYINHIVMGTVALAIGAVKLMDHALPKKPRWRAMLFPALMGIQAFLLITYTESIPWWAGIGHYNRRGPNGGCVGSFGNLRAEMAFDPETAQMDVRVLDRFKDEPVRVDGTNLNVLVKRQYRETLVPLTAVDADATGASHFRGQALFLANASQFDSSVTIPINGEQKTAHFDPWVIPAIVGIPPNEVARYVCPMHEGIRSKTDGTCQLCGMQLVPIQRNVTANLHDPKYTLKLDRQGDVLHFTPRLAGTDELVKNLLVVHEHLLHLIIVNEELTFFDHVHPVRQPDGSFQIPYRFPTKGQFVLYADITPGGERAQVFRLPVDNAGVADCPAKLLPDPVLAKEIGAYHVEMFLQPRTLVAQRETQFMFRLSQNGQPVTDLEPYIGAMGHCVILSEDTQSYLHCHPMQFTPQPPTSGGPEVAFHTEFPRPGRYKVWGQFKRDGKVIVADFVVNVEPPLLPRWLVTTLLFE